MIKVKLGLAALAPLVLSVSPVSMAQTDLKPALPPVPLVQVSPLDKPVAQAFVDELTKIAEQEGVTIIAEGQPTATVDLNKFPASAKSKDPVLDKLNAVADTFGYRVERKRDMFLLRKRYLVATDLPDVSIEECLAGLQDASTLLSRVDPKLPPETAKSDPLADGFLSKISLAQVDAMASGGLDMASLSPEARTEVEQVVRFFYVGDAAKETEAAVKALRAFVKHPPLLLLKSEGGTEEFGYEATTYPGQQLNLKKKPKAGELPGLIIRFADGEETVFFPFYLGRGTKPDASNKANPITVDVATNTSPVLLSLDQVVAHLNKQNADPVCAVDGIVASKTVTLINATRASSRDVMQGIASVHGLRLRLRDDGSLYLTRRVVPTPDAFLLLNESVRLATPDALMAAYQGRIKMKRQLQGVDLDKPLGSVDYIFAAEQLKEEATRLLWSRVEKQLRSREDKRLPLSELDHESQKLFTVVVVSTLYRGSAGFGGSPPPFYVSNFDNVVLTGGLRQSDDGQKLFGLYLGRRDPETGKVRSGSGFSTPHFNLPNQ